MSNNALLLWDLVNIGFSEYYRFIYVEGWTKLVAYYYQDESSRMKNT